MGAASINTDSLIGLNVAPALILDLEHDRITAANPQAVHLFQAPALDGRPFVPFLDDALQGMLLFLEEILYRGTAWTRSVDLRTAGGQSLHCEIRGAKLSEREDRVMLVFLDLDQLDRRARRMEDAKIQRGGLMEWQRAQVFFSELEHQNQLILNAAGEGIYGVNADGKTTFVNRAAQEMLGWTVDDLLGRDIHSMIHHHHLNGDHYPSHDCPIYQSFRHEEVSRIEDEVFWRKDGKPIRVEYVSTPIYDHAQLAGAVVIFRDITERKENERRLREAMDEVAALRDQLEQENTYLQEAISIERAHHDIVGGSPATRALLARVELVSRTSANILITGEPGTGKSLVASAIHKDSDLRRRPLIHFQCGSVTHDMTEVELFGHVRGANANARQDKAGALELANGGTLFLDEVTEIPLEVQGKLLTALQSHEVSRLGDTRSRDVNVRVIASTSRNLEREVQAGRFRQDLFFYLSVFPIHCTPLRDRPDDIPPLCAHLLGLACKRLNRAPPSITEGTIRRLKKYDWPGNVRELANVIERGAIVSTVDKLKVEINVAPVASNRSRSTLLTQADIDGIMIANLIACLRETGGKVAGEDGAAALLGIQATTLYSRIKKLGLTSADWA
ncbi:PAS domain S-box protein [Sulfitobacter sabulilitoris]|uniref:Nif-specific regulatory protein n=2 Tax=Sulfitobacter sabulilitoris TaxID=2562655 RepID=A0A5S3P7Z1_9RHOB|nr:PAS domain S-box protein [Sulfitobacter sabulilitoris]